MEDFDTFSQRIEKEKGVMSTISTDDQSGEGDAKKGQSQNGESHHKQHDTAASSSNDDGKESQSQQEQQAAPQKSQPKKEEKQAPQEKSQPQTPQKPEEQPKTQPQPKEQPQPKDEPQPQPKEEPKAKAKPSGGSGVTAKYSGQMFAGSMTYYDVSRVRVNRDYSLYSPTLSFLRTYLQVGLDACGNTDKKSDFIVAVAPEWFDEFSGGDSNPNHNKLCGQTINISKNGKTTQAKVADICPGEKNLKRVHDCIANTE